MGYVLESTCDILLHASRARFLLLTLEMHSRASLAGLRNTAGAIGGWLDLEAFVIALSWAGFVSSDMAL